MLDKLQHLVFNHWYCETAVRGLDERYERRPSI